MSPAFDTQSSADQGTLLMTNNRRNDQVTVFRVDRASGAVKFADQYLPVGSPNMIGFVS
jgi:6-phosphogluconolactonase